MNVSFRIRRQSSESAFFSFIGLDRFQKMLVYGLYGSTLRPSLTLLHHNRKMPTVNSIKIVGVAANKKKLNCIWIIIEKVCTLYILYCNCKRLCHYLNLLIVIASFQRYPIVPTNWNYKTFMNKQPIVS